MQDYKNVTGTEISKFQASTILKKLEIPFENTRQDHLKIHPPSFRVDIRENVDVIEELLRFAKPDDLGSGMFALPTESWPQVNEQKEEE